MDSLGALQSVCPGLGFALTPQGDVVALPFVVFPVPPSPHMLFMIKAPFFMPGPCNAAQIPHGERF